MIDRLLGERTTAGESVVLPFEVIVRRSTAAPRGRAASGQGDARQPEAVALPLQPVRLP